MRTISADTHLFGSRTGYATLSKSNGITESEDRELSTLGFGQTTDRSFLDSLEHDPCAYGRSLQSRRYAITRVFAGPNDDAGRPTLEFRSLVISADDAGQILSGDLEAVIGDDQLWSGEPFVAEKCVQMATPMVSRRQISDADIQMYEMWVQTINGQAIAVTGQDERSTILSWPKILPLKDRTLYRWGVRMLSVSAPVDVCTIVSTASRSGRRRILTLGHPSEKSRNDSLRAYLSSFVGKSQLPSLSMVLTPAKSGGHNHGLGPELITPDKPCRLRMSSVVAAVVIVAMLGCSAILAVSWLRKREVQPATVFQDTADPPIGTEQSSAQTDDPTLVTTTSPSADRELDDASSTDSTSKPPPQSSQEENDHENSETNDLKQPPVNDAPTRSATRVKIAPQTPVEQATATTVPESSPQATEKWQIAKIVFDGELPMPNPRIGEKLKKEVKKAMNEIIEFIGTLKQWDEQFQVVKDEIKRLEELCDEEVKKRVMTS